MSIESIPEEAVARALISLWGMSCSCSSFAIYAQGAVA